MTPDQIIQLRQILKQILVTSNTEPRTEADAAYRNLARNALALLPCETCNDLWKEIPNGKSCPNCPTVNNP